MLQIDSYNVKNTFINAVDWHATLIIKMIQKISLAPFAYTYVYFFYTLFRIIQLTLVNYKFRAGDCTARWFYDVIFFIVA